MHREKTAKPAGGSCRVFDRFGCCGTTVASAAAFLRSDFGRANDAAGIGHVFKLIVEKEETSQTGERQIDGKINGTVPCG
jgi:hypothetical protein